MKSVWKSGLVMLLLVGIVVLGACSEKSTTEQTSDGNGSVVTPTAPKWLDVPLTDVASGQTFRLSDFKGKPILLESFAVWCPTCLRQQLQMKKMQSIDSENIVHVSLDTDPNEDTSKVLGHLETNGLDWYFAVPPIEMTSAIIDDIGLRFVNATSAPVILICEDQSYRFLPNGVKSADRLLAEVEKGCE